MAKSQWLAEPSSKPGLLIFGARLVFAKLKKTFIEISIFHYFDPIYYILVKTDILDYIIGKVLSQLTLNDLDQKYRMAFFLER